MYNAGEVAAIIIKENEKDIEDLGGDIDSQQSYIFKYMNVVMWKLAKLAERVTTSDAVTLSADGPVTFTKSGIAITNIFEPKVIYMPNGQPMAKRTADEAPVGWWRESDTQEIHVRGFTLTSNQKLLSGGYTLKYIRYPNKVTLATDELDWPRSGYDVLIKEVSSLIKLSKNSYQGADYMDNKAKQSYGNLVQGAVSARGTGTTGQPTGFNDMQTAKGG